MNDTGLLGPWVRRFLLEHLVAERNLSRNTQRSYRDTLCLLLPFVGRKTGIPADQLLVDAISADMIRSFLLHLEKERRCGIATRNQRLAAIRSLARFVAERSPEHIPWCTAIRAVPSKKATQDTIPYLEKAEMEALLAAPDQRSPLGHRDYTLLLFLYNSGARADEAAQLTIADLELPRSPNNGQAAVTLVGKGNKVRRCPLWSKTAEELNRLIASRGADTPVFLNRRGQPITRFGVHAVVQRHVRRIVDRHPSLAKKRVSPHTIRHTTATHLLRAGVDINTIRSWLGHASVDTTQIYVEIDLQAKARALAHCEVTKKTSRRRWRNDPDLMAFLRQL
jgi:site-specific recombinase XerD